LQIRETGRQPPAMTWFVQFRFDGSNHTNRHPTPEEAIEAACRLIKGGCDVYGLGTGPVTASLDKDQIARIYELWARPERPFGLS
jgi:hypothetical protein